MNARMYRVFCVSVFTAAATVCSPAAELPDLVISTDSINPYAWRL
jgi:hypothetical protein